MQLQGQGLKLGGEQLLQRQIGAETHRLHRITPFAPQQGLPSQAPRAALQRRCSLAVA